MPNNVVSLRDRRERREPQRWWERAQAGVLYGTDDDGNPNAKDMTGDAA